MSLRRLSELLPEPLRGLVKDFLLVVWTLAAIWYGLSTLIEGEARIGRSLAVLDPVTSRIYGSGILLLALASIFEIYADALRSGLEEKRRFGHRASLVTFLFGGLLVAVTTLAAISR